MRATKFHDTVVVEITRWDRLIGWFRHVLGRCDAWCLHCYTEACSATAITAVGQYWKFKRKEGDPDPCVCGLPREKHVQLYPDDPGPRGACYYGKCRGFELPLHDNVYESPLTAGTYKTYDFKTEQLVDRPITWQHDRKRCRVCNGAARTVRGL